MLALILLTVALLAAPDAGADRGDAAGPLAEAEAVALRASEEETAAREALLAFEHLLEESADAETRRRLTALSRAEQSEGRSHRGAMAALDAQIAGVEADPSLSPEERRRMLEALHAERRERLATFDRSMRAWTGERRELLRPLAAAQGDAGRYDELIEARERAEKAAREAWDAYLRLRAETAPLR